MQQILPSNVVFPAPFGPAIIIILCFLATSDAAISFASDYKAVLIIEGTPELFVADGVAAEALILVKPFECALAEAISTSRQRITNAD